MYRSLLGVRSGFTQILRLSFICFVLLTVVSGFHLATVARSESPLLESQLLKDKTFVVWCSPANYQQQGGSVLTLETNHSGEFDAIVFGEIMPAKWMAGSEFHLRTEKQQNDYPIETAGPEKYVQLAVVYQGRQVTLYRNSQLYAQYTTDKDPPSFGSDANVLFGRRYVGAAEEHAYFSGKILDARIYPVALPQKAIAALKPGKHDAALRPWAWWAFGESGMQEWTGRFAKIREVGKANISDGALQLGPNDWVMASQGNPAQEFKKDANQVAPSVPETARALREKFLADPTRPGYHFVIPEGRGIPGDPNGSFYANGRYHLMYLYRRDTDADKTFCWGHASTRDLLHWRLHEDAIGKGPQDKGGFSGGAFIDDDGTAYLSYWIFGNTKGIGIYKSTGDRHFDRWSLMSYPAIESTEWGITETTDQQGNKVVYGTADPSNIWKKDGKYYMLTGNILVLDKYGREPDSPLQFQGDRVYLFESPDLHDWKYRGVFYERNPDWTDQSEDNMCPVFLPLPSSPDGGPASDKHLMLFISHNRGCQYFIGHYDQVKDRFLPEKHGRMSWVDNAFFAPESVLGPDGRQIMWAWLLDNPPADDSVRGWTGVYGLPRSLWLDPTGHLGIRPIEELKKLRYNHQQFAPVQLVGGESKKLDVVPGDMCELEIVIHPGQGAKQFGLEVRASPDGQDGTRLYYDRQAKELVMDMSRSSHADFSKVERAPFELGEDEPLRLRVFLDKPVVEIYANDRQSIARRVYPFRWDSQDIKLFSTGGPVNFSSIDAWEMMPSNPF